MPGPLDGVRVLELGQIIAGPYAATALADLGAEVVKLEPPGGEGGRRLGQFAPGESKAFHTLSRGKRGIVVDLRMSRGREVVHRLIADFDVFVTNARPGVPERIGVDYETLRRYRPDLIYLHITGFGDPKQVPVGALDPQRLQEITQRAGSDVIVQAYSGLLAADEKVDRHGAPEPITATAPADWVAAFGGAMGCARRSSTASAPARGST